VDTNRIHQNRRAIRAVQILFASDGTQFHWHQDNRNAESGDDPITDIEFTVIYTLTEGKTAMQVGGKQEYTYPPYGAVLFQSELWHRSCGAEKGGVKVTVFVAQHGSSRSIGVLHQ
jgi:hypothetical protein